MRYLKLCPTCGETASGVAKQCPNSHDLSAVAAIAVPEEIDLDTLATRIQSHLETNLDVQIPAPAIAQLILNELTPAAIAGEVDVAVDHEAIGTATARALRLPGAQPMPANLHGFTNGVADRLATAIVNGINTGQLALQVELTDDMRTTLRDDVAEQLRLHIHDPNDPNRMTVSSLHDETRRQIANNRQSRAWNWIFLVLLLAILALGIIALAMSGSSSDTKSDAKAPGTAAPASAASAAPASASQSPSDCVTSCVQRALSKKPDADISSVQKACYTNTKCGGGGMVITLPAPQPTARNGSPLLAIPMIVQPATMPVSAPPPAPKAPPSKGKKKPKKATP